MSNYMKRGLSIYVGAVDVYFIVIQKCDCVMYVTVRYRMEHNVVTDLFDLPDHLNYIQTKF